MFTSLNAVRDAKNAEQQIGSLIDTWIIVKLDEQGWSRNRVLYVLKSRGMAHSHEIREFLLSERGLEIAGVRQAVGG